MDVIQRIEDLRQERGWSKYRLAEEAMILYSTLAGIYARGTPPKIDTLEQICNAFGLTLAQFFSDNDDAIILSDEEKELIRVFRKMNAEKRRLFIRILSEADRIYPWQD